MLLLLPVWIGLFDSDSTKIIFESESPNIKFTEGPKVKRTRPGYPYKPLAVFRYVETAGMCVSSEIDKSRPSPSFGSLGEEYSVRSRKPLIQLQLQLQVKGFKVVTLPRPEKGVKISCEGHRRYQLSLSRTDLSFASAICSL